MDDADLIWNRAALEGGGPEARAGDLALTAALSFHNLVMSGGMLFAVEHPLASADAAEAGYRWLGLDLAADVVASVFREHQAVPDDQLEELELRANAAYALVIPDDDPVERAFRRRLAEEPDAFAKLR